MHVLPEINVGIKQITYVKATRFFFFSQKKIKATGFMKIEDGQLSTLVAIVLIVLVFLFPILFFHLKILTLYNALVFL